MHAVPFLKRYLKKICLILIIALCIFLAIKLTFNLNPQKEKFSTSSSLIDVKDIARLSVSEFVYNGIGQTFKSNGEPEMNILYKATVKVSIDPEDIKCKVDDDKKVVAFTLPPFTLQDAIIDTSSIKYIPDGESMEIKDAITICRKDAMAAAEKSEKLMLLAKDNLRAIVVAWYSPILDGYTFEFVFTEPDGSEAE